MEWLHDRPHCPSDIRHSTHNADPRATNAPAVPCRLQHELGSPWLPTPARLQHCTRGGLLPCHRSEGIGQPCSGTVLHRLHDPNMARDRCIHRQASAKDAPGLRTLIFLVGCLLSLFSSFINCIAPMESGIDKGKTRTRATGTQSAVEEVCHELAWLSSALRNSPFEPGATHAISGADISK